MRLRPAVFMVLATLFWAGNYVLGPVALASLSPFELTWMRWLLAAVPLLVVAQIVEKPDWTAVLRAWPRLLLLASLGMVAYTLLLYEALGSTTAIGASLINAANPATMALLAAVLVGERVRRRGVVGIAISLVGVILILSNGSLPALLRLEVNAGQLLMLAAIVVWSLYSIWGRRQGAVPPITATAAQAVIVVIVMTPIAFVTGFEIPGQPAPIAALVYIALFPSVGSYLLWNLALRTTPASVAGIYLNLITVFTVVIGLALGQQVSPLSLVGGAVVIFGVILTSLPGRRPGMGPGADGVPG